MIRADASAGIRLEAGTGHAWGVAIARQVPRGPEFGGQPDIGGEDSGEVHHLPQGHGFRPGQHGFDIAQRELGSGAFQGAGGYTRGHGEADIERQTATCVAKCLDRRQPANVRQLVGIGHDRPGAPGHDGAGDFRWPKHGAFEMKVRIDERWGDYQVPGVNHRPAFRETADPGNDAGVDRDIRLDQLPGEDIEVTAPLEDELGRELTLGDRDPAPPLPPPLEIARCCVRVRVLFRHGAPGY